MGGARTRDRLAAVMTAKDLAQFLNAHLDAFDDLAIREWPSGTLDAWKAGQIPGDLNEIRRFAKAIDVDGPLFIGKAVEVIERQTATSA